MQGAPGMQGAPAMQGTSGMQELRDAGNSKDTGSSWDVGNFRVAESSRVAVLCITDYYGWFFFNCCFGFVILYILTCMCLLEDHFLDMSSFLPPCESQE